MRLVALAVLGLLLTGSYATAQVKPTSFDVSVTDANVHGLVVALSVLSNSDVAVGGFADERLTLKGTFSSFDDFLDTIAKRLNGQIRTHSATKVLTKSCIVRPPSPSSILNSKRINLEFARIDPAQIINLLYGVSLGERELRDRLEPAQQGLIGLRLRDMELPAILEIVSLSSGIEVTESRDGSVQAVSVSTCSPLKHESYEAPSPDLHMPDCERNSPEISQSKGIKCEPLEHYKLENIVVKGLAVGGQHRSTVALAETPDGVTWQLRPGDRLGKDNGRVMDVTASGITLREILVNPYGYIYEQTILIDYQNHRKPMLPP